MVMVPQRSYFGRINFNWVDKYLFTVNLRNDGSDKFPTDKSWAAYVLPVHLPGK